MSNFIVNTDIPNLRVVIREGDQYNINIVPGRITTQVTGSFTTYADLAGLALSASYISGSNVIAESSSYALTASYAETINRQIIGSVGITGSTTITDNLNVQGVISAEQLIVSSSIIYESGSTKFGDSPDDTHQFTGSVSIQGPLNASSFTGSIYLEPVSESYAFQIPFVSESSGRAKNSLAVDATQHLTFNPSTHVLQISGGVGNNTGVAQLSPRGATFTSGSNFSGILNQFGIFSEVNKKTVGLVADPSVVNPSLVNNTNPAIYVTSGTLQSTGYVPIEFQGSGSYTDGRVTVNTPLVAKQSVEVTGSATITEFVKSNEYKLNAGTVSIIFTGSINQGIFGVTEYVQPYISTTEYSGMTVEYLAQRPGACRMGIIMASWLNTASIVFTDISTTDIGDTSDISFRFLSSSNELRLRVNSEGTGTGAWTVQSLFKLFPNLNS